MKINRDEIGDLKEGETSNIYDASRSSSAVHNMAEVIEQINNLNKKNIE